MLPQLCPLLKGRAHIIFVYDRLVSGFLVSIPVKTTKTSIFQLAV